MDVMDSFLGKDIAKLIFIFLQNFQRGDIINVWHCDSSSEAMEKGLVNTINYYNNKIIHITFYGDNHIFNLENYLSFKSGNINYLISKFAISKHGNESIIFQTIFKFDQIPNFTFDLN